MPDLKQCTECGSLKPHSAFHSRPDRKSLRARCRECVALDCARRYRARAEHQRSVGSKVCTHCEIRRPLDQYRKQRRVTKTRSYEALHSWCIRCTNAAAKERMRKLAQRPDRVAERAARTALRAAAKAKDPPFTPEQQRIRANEAAARHRKRNAALHAQRQARYHASEKGRDHQRVNRANTRARQFVAMGRLTYVQWCDIREMFDHACVYCDAKGVPLTIDHLMPLARGGTNWPENIVPACKPCNDRKSTLSLRRWLMHLHERYGGLKAAA